MRALAKSMMAGGLLAALFGLLPSPVTAQYLTPAPAAYYYAAPGYYPTTAGTVYIPAAGYYYNAPAAFAPNPGGTPFVVTTPAPVPTYRAAVSHSDNPNNPPYYMGVIHSLHARGHDASAHGR